MRVGNIERGGRQPGVPGVCVGDLDVRQPLFGHQLPRHGDVDRVIDLVRSFTGGFTEASMKATRGGADAEGTTAGATTTNGPSAEEHRSKAASADAA